MVFIDFSDKNMMDNISFLKESLGLETLLDIKDDLLDDLFSARTYKKDDWELLANLGGDSWNFQLPNQFILNPRYEDYDFRRVQYELATRIEVISQAVKTALLKSNCLSRNN